MYDINHATKVKTDVWAATRQSKHLAWLNVLIAPVKSLHALLLIFIQRTTEDINTTGQVVKLRTGLNAKFDYGFNRIEIVDATAFGTTFIFLASENMPLYLPEYIGGVAVDFEVRIPSELMSLESQIRAFLDRYKLPTKNYRIVWI